MIEYENSAVDLTEKLKEKQQAEMREFIDKNRAELGSKMHYSKYIIELITTEK